MQQDEHDVLYMEDDGPPPLEEATAADLAPFMAHNTAHANANIAYLATYAGVAKDMAALFSRTAPHWE
jgi:hypothetical protein